MSSVGKSPGSSGAAAVQGAAFAFLAALLALLWLNLQESDVYFEGTDEPVRPASAGGWEPPAGLTPEYRCGCEACGAEGGCVYAARVLDAASVYRVVDGDGWYRLFWAGDDTYYFADVSRFLSAMENRSWSRAEGVRRYDIAYERRCSYSGGEHACADPVPVRVRLAYTLVLGPPPAAEPIRDGPLEIPTWLPDAARSYETVYRDRVLSSVVTVGWVLAERDGVSIDRAPCRCPR